MRRKSRLATNFEWYRANLNSLLRRYRGRFIAFSDGTVIGAYDTAFDAAKGAVASGYPLGSFAVHRCVPANQEKALAFASSRADFSKAGI